LPEPTQAHTTDPADPRGPNGSEHEPEVEPGNDVEIEPDNPEEAAEANARFSLHPDDPQNFLKLSSALIILTKKTITTAELLTADTYLRQYCAELISVCSYSCSL